MERARDHALAGAGLAADQDRRAACRAGGRPRGSRRACSKAATRVAIAADQALGQRAVAPAQPARARGRGACARRRARRGAAARRGRAASAGSRRRRAASPRRRRRPSRTPSSARPAARASRPAQALQHVEAALVRQAQVEEHEIRRRRLDGGDARRRRSPRRAPRGRPPRARARSGVRAGLRPRSRPASPRSATLTRPAGPDRGYPAASGADAPGGGHFRLPRRASATPPAPFRAGTAVAEASCADGRASRWRRAC